MIKSYKILFIIIINCNYNILINSFNFQVINHNNHISRLKYFRKKIVPYSKEHKNIHQENEKIPVEFINTPFGYDILEYANIDENLIEVAERAGILIPTGCMSGICGICQCDIKYNSLNDESNKQNESEKNGNEFNTILACSKKVRFLNKQDKIIVDLYRMQKKRNLNKTEMNEVYKNPMKRFEKDWEKNFVPDYKKYNENKSYKRTLPNNVAPWDYLW